MKPQATTSPVDLFLTGIEAGAIPGDVFADDAALDATVPNWRFTVRGGVAVRAQLADWFADPGEFLSLRRTPLPDGELVEFTLRWTEAGVEHACHQAHILTVAKDRIAADTAFCGGRWPAPLMADMQRAAEQVLA
jgi:hypothetical protein